MRIQKPSTTKSNRLFRASAQEGSSHPRETVSHRLYDRTREVQQERDRPDDHSCVAELPHVSPDWGIPDVLLIVWSLAVVPGGCPDDLESPNLTQ